MTAKPWPEIKAVLADVMEADPSARPALLERLCRDDTELRRAVESLLALETRADAVLDSAALPGTILRAAPEAPPETIGPYRILSEIGRGGMGVVYLAERADGQYRKQVAIKVVTTRWRDPGLEQRFQRERQILAQLEHPAIARFLDGGSTPEGRPYFVMEYIHGLPLLAWCRDHIPSVPARLDLFLQVCDAVSYAHQRLIVHRDLKPGNILVTEDGVAKLLDFGLARVLVTTGEAGEDITLTAAPLMTPAYASPEQVRGELYTVAGDVYSLGVILYELLAGQRPYQVSTTSYLEMARVICEQEPPLLSRAVADAQLGRALAGDLERITAKALAKEPKLRYATVDDFSADVRRHLDGRPVNARPATFGYRAGKLFGRHRYTISAGIIALILIVAFAGVAWWEARRAQRRFEDVRRLAHSVIFELHDAIAKLPGSTAARELLVRRALEYLEGLSRESSRDPALSREVALAYEKIAEVQGDLAEPNLGHMAAARQSFSKSEDILAGLLARSPTDESLRRDYLRVANSLALADSELGQYQVGTVLARRVIAIAEAALRENPSRPETLAQLASGESTLATILTEQQDYQGAIPVRERVLDLARRAAAAARGGTGYNVAVAHKRLAALYAVTGRFDDARREYEAARTLDEARAAAHPSDLNARFDLSYDYSDLAWVDSRTNALDSALAGYRRALALRQEAVAADPNNYRATTGVASLVDRIAGVMRRQGNYSDSVAESRHALKLYAALAARPAAHWRDWTELAETHVNFAETFVALANWPEATAEYQKARDIFAQLRDKGQLPPPQRERMKEIEDLLSKARQKTTGR